MNDNNGKITVYVNLKSKLLFLSMVRMALSHTMHLYTRYIYKRIRTYIDAIKLL